MQMKLAMDLSALERLRPVSSNAVTTTAVTDGRARFAKVLDQARASVGRTSYDACFEAAAERYNIPVNLLKAVGKAESSFRADAVSHCGAQGIMQLMPATARSLGVTDSFDPAQNIMGGAKYLRQMLDAFDGNVSYALAAYNAGAGAVKKYGGIPPYKETQNYVAKVLSYAGGDIQAVGTASGSGISSAVPAAAASESADMGSLSGEELEDLMETLFADHPDLKQEQVRLLLDRILFQYLNDQSDKELQQDEEDEEMPSLSSVSRL